MIFPLLIDRLQVDGAAELLEGRRVQVRVVLLQLVEHLDLSVELLLHKGVQALPDLGSIERAGEVGIVRRHDNTELLVHLADQAFRIRLTLLRNKVVEQIVRELESEVEVLGAQVIVPSTFRRQP